MNSFGRIFRVSIFGESHGKSVGVVIDGCPAGITVSENDFLDDLIRRKSGAKGTTSRIEHDKPNVLSGIFNGKTTGTPITISFENTNTKSGDYSDFKDIPRPGHADFVADKKYKGSSDYRGGGHFSGRITLGLVVAGVIAKKLLKSVKINSEITEAGGSTNIEKAVEKAVAYKDSIGAIIECSITGVPVGLGEPFFDSVESTISHLVFSVPGIKGIEFGSGFNVAKMRGSECNDLILDASGKTATNHSGGINGGITNGNDIVFRVAVKPTSSIGKVQKTYNFATDKIEEIEVKGRHDACIALRMPVIIEAISAIALCDLLLIDKSLSS